MAMYWPIKQLNLSLAGTLGQKKVTVVGMFKQESMYGLTDKKVAVAERWSLGWFSNRTRTSFDDGKAREND